jgi:hypothetical protein
MTEVQLLVGSVLAMLFGALGQGARAIVGLKKRAERNAAKSNTDSAAAAAADVAGAQDPTARAEAIAGGSSVDSPARTATEAEPFDGKEFAASFAIGAVAGLTAFLGLYFNDASVKITTGSTILGIVAAGYTGSDFIEGFVKKHVPK